MPGENLTRIEAQERQALVEVESYDVELDLTTGPTTFRSRTTVRFTASAGASTFIDAITEKVHSVVLNGSELGTDVADGARIALDGLAPVNELTVIADFAYTNTGEGLHRFVDPVDGEVYLYSQFEVPDSRRVYSVFEQPDLKAEFRFTVTAPDAWQLVSNSPTPEPENLGNGTAIWRFAPTPRISSYITALIAGPYEVVRSELTSSDGRTIPLGVFARKSLFGYLDADYVFDITRKGFAYFEEKFGYPYPFVKYDQLFVPEFNAGAMENAGAVTFTETYVFRSKVTDAVKERRVVTILHELAHMWFGDLVTMKWWNDLWLNESFAEWASTIATAEATEWTEAWTTFQAMEKSWAYRQDQLPSTHPVVADIRDLDDVQVNFDGITYAKGGSVLKQLAAWVGIDAFFAGVGAYFRAHAYGNTELADLLRELEKSSGRDLSAFSAQWLETSGVNTLKPEIETDAAGVITAFRVRQSAHPDYPTLRQHRMAIGFYDLASEAADAPLVRVHRHEFDLAASEWNDIPELVGLAKPALVLLNDDDLAYAKIRMDDASFRIALDALSRIQDPLARALVWGSAWDSTRDGEIAGRDYVRLVLENIGAETESTTMRLTLGQLVLTARLYVDPATRAATIREVGDALWQLAQDAEAGSDAQFQFVKFFANIASTAEHATVLQRLRSGELALDGLEIDTDLGWELLEGLVLVGAAGEPEIAAALAKDDTANGQQAAARARATVPSPDAKEATLRAALTDASLSNVILRNMALGFTHTNDPSALAPLVPLYFDSIRRVWDERSFQLAQYIVEGFYPSTLATAELVEASRAWLAANEEPAALRRMVVEVLAGVERALAAQARDAAT
ncbi:MAG: aminopeptidase N [Leifsonia xyli]|nr:MAG: aminopeptidase N [Leifsonia xyli]